MLFSVQFPIADARKFVTQVERLGRPGWPLPTPNSEFVRFFGAIRTRTLGGLAGWLGEDIVCNANRALTFSKYPSPLKGRTRIIYRRFYSDGWAVGKLEVGFHIERHQFPTVRGLANHFLHLPVRIRNGLGSQIDSDLAQAGKHLAHLYLIASSPTNRALLERDKWQIRAGSPLLCLELREDEGFRTPREAKQIELPDWTSGLQLFHYGVPYRGGNISMWIVQRGKSLSSVDRSKVRALRLYLLRLNAEHECLRLILQSIANKDIQVTRGTPASDDLQMYLDKALKRIRHFEEKTGDVHEKIAEMARQSINIIRPGQLDALLENVIDYRKYIREKIENYVTQDASIINYGYMEVHKMENRQGNTYNFSNFQAGILNIESTLTNVSQSVGSIPNMEQSSKDELKQLIDQLNTALQKAPADKIEEANAIAETTEDLVKDLTKDKPNKVKLQITLDGLKKAAANMAKVLPDVMPIAIRLAAVVSKSFGLA